MDIETNPQPFVQNTQKVKTPTSVKMPNSDPQPFVQGIQEVKMPNSDPQSFAQGNKPKGDQADTKRKKSDETKSPDNIQTNTAEALLGDIPECSHPNDDDVAHIDNNKVSKYFISLETSPIEKEIIEDIKDRVQEKLLLPNPDNRMKQHASHVTLGIIEIMPSEEDVTAKQIEEVLQVVH